MPKIRIKRKSRFSQIVHNYERKKIKVSPKDYLKIHTGNIDYLINNKAQLLKSA